MGVLKAEGWMTPAASAEFGKATECFVDQYSKFKVKGGQAVNGRLTVGENIADNGGLARAYKAYKTSGPAEESVSSCLGRRCSTAAGTRRDAFLAQFC
jgi:predicted metalloendopeptidase